MTQPDPRYVSASEPVNRRTAKPVAPRPEPVNPVVQQRLAAKWAAEHVKNRLGAPLAEQLHTATISASRTSAMTPAFITGAVVASMSGVGLLLAVIGRSLLLAGSSAVALAVGAGLMRVVSRRFGAAAPEAVNPLMATTLFDAASIAAFDEVVRSMAAEATDDITAALAGLKQQLVRIAQRAASAGVDEHFTLDDRLYLRELLRRYLPDSLEAYLRVPADQRLAPVLEHGASAASLLLGQLDMLAAQLSQRETRLTVSKAGDLLKQQRFLTSKTSR
jgi:hypothetical protein